MAGMSDESAPNGARLQLSPTVAWLGAVSLLTAMSSAMVYGLLPVFLKLAVTQGLLAASVADAAPAGLRGTAFGVYELIVGIAAFAASAGAGLLWGIGGASLACAASAGVAALTMAALIVARR